MVVFLVDTSSVCLYKSTVEKRPDHVAVESNST